VYDSPLLSLLSQFVPSAQTTSQDGDDERVASSATAHGEFVSLSHRRRSKTATTDRRLRVASSASARGELVKLLVEDKDVSPRLPGPLASAAKAVKRRLAVQRSYQPHVVTETRASQRSHTNSVSNIKSHRNVGQLPDSHKHRQYSPGLSNHCRSHSRTHRGIKRPALHDTRVPAQYVGKNCRSIISHKTAQ